MNKRNNFINLALFLIVIHGVLIEFLPSNNLGDSLRRIREEKFYLIGKRISSALGDLALPLREALNSGNKKLAEEIVNRINAYKGDSDNLVIGDIELLGNFLKSSSYEEYKRKAIDVILKGGYVAEIFAAGAATRLGKGPLFGLNFWKTIESFKEQRHQVISLITNYLQGQILLSPTDKKELSLTLIALSPDTQNYLTKFLIDKGIIKKNLEELLNEEEKINKLVEDKTSMEMVLQKIKEDPPLLIPENAIKNIDLGARQLIQLRVNLTKLARENRENVDSVLGKQMIVLHINEEIEECVRKTLIEHNFFGFSPENIIILVQPVLPGFDINPDGKVIVRSDSDRFPYGHGYATEQLTHRGAGYVLDKKGNVIKLEQSVLETILNKNGKIMGTHRINDLTRYIYEKQTINGIKIKGLDIDKIALSLYLMDKEKSNVIVELVDNPEGQKGGLFLKDKITGKLFLLEGLNTNTPEIQAKLSQLTQEIQRKGDKGIPYNAFRLIYNLRNLSTLLSHTLPNSVRIRGKTNSLYLELVTGDITFLEEANTKGFQNKGELIQDFKSPSFLLLGIEYISLQDTDVDFREVVLELYK